MRRWLERALSAITLRAGWLLGAVAVCAALAVLALVNPKTGEPRLLLDPSWDSMLPKDEPSRATLERVKHLFGSEESILVVLSADDIFTADNLRRIQRLTERLEDLELVERVSSLSASLNIRSRNGELLVEPFFDEIPADAAGLADLRQRALSDPIYAGNLVSHDGRASLINVHFVDVSEQELYDQGTDAAITEIALEESGDAEVWITGGPHLKAETTRLMFEHLATLVPLSWVVMAGVAFAAFRTLRGMLIPVLTVQLSLLGTLAFVALAIGNLNVLTIAAPPILVVFGLAYAIHMLSAYYDALRGVYGIWADRRAAVRLALEHVAIPVIFTGLTTGLAFFSLMLSPLGAVRQFGAFCGIGAVVTTVVALTFVPAVLVLLPVPRRAAGRPTRGHFDHMLEAIARFDVRHRKAILVAGAGVAIIALAGVPRIEISSSTIRDLRSDNPVLVHFEKVNAGLEGANAFSVIVEGGAPGAFKQPAKLKELDDLQSFIEAQPEVGGTTSVADYVKVINRGFHDDRPSAFEIPDTQALVSQLLLIGDNDELDQFIDGDFETANVLVRTSAIESNEVAALADRIDLRLEGLGEGLRGTVTGNTVLLSRTSDEIIFGQVVSLLAALGIVYIVLAFLFASPRVGLIALIPNALPMLVFFGILGWFGLALNTSTSLVACLVLGIAVDDTIHLMVRFNEAAKKSGHEEQGIVETLRTVGRPVTFTTVALCLGFLCMLPSGLKTAVDFGVLSAVTLAIAWLIDMTFTPALAIGMRIVTIWDVLTLDLGANPQRSIPVLSGLRNSQARIVALVSSLHDYPSGAVLTRVGEKGSEMYIVVDGELTASRGAGDGRVELRRLRRGDVFGEVAHFYGGERTADVEAVTAVRLIRITENSMQRLARWHPRTGARVHANLNRVLAERLASVTPRVR